MALLSQRRDDDSWEEENLESWECSGAGADAVDVLDVNTLSYFIYLIFSIGGGFGYFYFGCSGRK